MDKTTAPDAQLIPQLQDTNIQINRLMLQQLNRLNDTIKQLQLTDAANFRQDPSLQSRTQQLQALLPIMKTALEHQQTFYHQCLKLHHARNTLQHQVLRLATNLDKSKPQPSTAKFDRSNTPPSPTVQSVENTQITTFHPPLQLQERKQSTHHTASTHHTTLHPFNRTASRHTHHFTSEHRHRHTARSDTPALHVTDNMHTKHHTSPKQHHDTDVPPPNAKTNGLFPSEQPHNKNTTTTTSVTPHVPGLTDVPALHPTIQRSAINSLPVRSLTDTYHNADHAIDPTTDLGVQPLQQKLKHTHQVATLIDTLHDTPPEHLTLPHHNHLARHNRHSALQKRPATVYLLFNSHHPTRLRPTSPKHLTPPRQQNNLHLHPHHTSHRQQRHHHHLHHHLPSYSHHQKHHQSHLFHDQKLHPRHHRPRDRHSHLIQSDRNNHHFHLHNACYTLDNQTEIQRYERGTILSGLIQLMSPSFQTQPTPQHCTVHDLEPTSLPLY